MTVCIKLLFTEPYLDILIQPKQHGYRFRYMCEGSSLGSLVGEGSTYEQKVYPTVQVDCPLVAEFYQTHKH